MIVRLKDRQKRNCRERKCGFNSMIVRLKADFKRKQGVPRKGFNSMIVRLKVTPAAAPIAVPMFQFYDSPIKSALTGEVLGKGSGVSIL